MMLIIEHGVGADRGYLGAGVKMPAYRLAQIDIGGRIAVHHDYVFRADVIYIGRHGV